jgi:hypothetical protein
LFAFDRCTTTSSEIKREVLVMGAKKKASRKKAVLLFFYYISPLLPFAVKYCPSSFCGDELRRNFTHMRASD